MKRIPITVITCFVLVLHLSAQPAKHVVLISIDAMRPDFYRDLSWPAPNLQQMAREGVQAVRVKPVFPSITYPNHVTMITGALPARHGVFFNVPFEPLGASGKWNWMESIIQVPTLWDALHKAGLRSAAIQWPVSAGGPIDYCVPEIWDPAQPEDRITVPGKYAAKGLVEELEDSATGKLNGNNVNEEWLSMDENSGRMAAYIIRHYKPGFLALHLLSVDGQQHAQGREGQKVRLAVASVDRAIGDVLEAIERAGLKDSTAVLVVGDHGFVNIHSALFPNVWLAQKGLLGKGANWKVKFQSASGAAFLYLQDPNDMNTLTAVRKMLNELPEGMKRLFRVLDKDELKKAGADPHAALALNPLPGLAIGNAAQGAVLRPAHGGTHGYYPDFPEIMTGLVGMGAGMAKGVEIPEMGMQDIAPLIAKLLGLEFEAPDGVLLPGLVK
ncbi:MAG: alkaline phosphatase family protein [Bacteroidetes bacterium]|nr:alkaline phosphatase family protein [Bacteroidota bacterium]